MFTPCVCLHGELALRRSTAALADGAVQSPKAAAGEAPNTDNASNDSWSAYEVNHLLGCMQPRLRRLPSVASTSCISSLYPIIELMHID